MMLKKIFPKIYFKIKNTHIYLILLSQKERYKDIVVSKSSDIVIEGFPRSANTFLTTLINYTSEKELKIARHVHSSAQIIKGIKYGIPTILLIRDPKDAIASFLIKFSDNSSPKNLEKKIKSLVYYYIKFHELLIVFKKKILVIDFNNVINNSPDVIESINDRYQLSLSSDFLHVKTAEVVFNKIKQQNINKVDHDKNKLAIPSKEKNESKKQLYPLIENSPYYNKAENIYKEFLIQ